MGMAVRIGLFADKGSRQLAEIAETVAEIGARPVVCDIQLGGASGASCAIGPEVLRWAGEDFSDVRAVHIRCTAPRTLPALPAIRNAATDAEYRASFLREQEWQAATYAFFDCMVLDGALVANPLTSAYIDHNSKGQLYEKLRGWGFRAPASLTTNDPAEARAFLDRVGEAVCKPAIGIGSTRLVTEADRDRLDELVTCPVLFQHRVPGEIVRVHVVGDTMVLALLVESDSIDSRTAPKGFRYLELSAEESALIVGASRALGLHYAGWDAILSTDGTLTYLDCNPGPNLMWIDPKFRKIVFVQLATYLKTFAETGEVAEASRRVVGWRPQ